MYRGQGTGPHLPVETVDEETEEEEASPVNVSQLMPPADPRLKLSRTKQFVIVYSRGRKFARLHRTDSNCPWSRHEVFDSIEIDAPLPEMYNARCKLCWPAQAGSAEEESDIYESEVSGEED